MMEQVSTCGVFYRAPPDTHPDAQGGASLRPECCSCSAVETEGTAAVPLAAGYRRQRHRGGAEIAFTPPAEAAQGPPTCACDGVRNSFHACCGVPPQLQRRQTYSHSVQLKYGYLGKNEWKATIESKVIIIFSN